MAMDIYTAEDDQATMVPNAARMRISADAPQIYPETFDTERPAVSIDEDRLQSLKKYVAYVSARLYGKIELKVGIDN